MADGIEKLLGVGANGCAYFIFEFDGAGEAVAGEVEDVISVASDGVGDDFGVADFEDADFDVVEELGGLDGVEDVLEFAFEVEDGAAGGLIFVGRADGDQDFDGAGE